MPVTRPCAPASSLFGAYSSGEGFRGAAELVAARQPVTQTVKDVRKSIFGY
jgi:hypothetical protein